MSQPKDHHGDPEGKAQGWFPLEYFVDFLKLLRDRDDLFELITYEDLPWEDDYDFKRDYPREYRRWKAQLKDGTRDSRRIHVLLQHDVDTRPERTLAILKQEAELGVPSNVMIFNRRIDRARLRDEGDLAYTPYEVNHEFLGALERESGFVIGYHTNALERAAFDAAKAQAIFEEDVAALRKHFPLRYFSAHGGVRGPRGRSNSSMTMPRSLKTSIRWVGNPHSPRFDGNYSDGGLNSPLRDPRGRDLRDFVRSWRRGGRYRVLTHPQYYHSPPRPSPRMAGTAWYDELLADYEPGAPGTAWKEIAKCLGPAAS